VRSSVHAFLLDVRCFSQLVEPILEEDRSINPHMAMGPQLLLRTLVEGTDVVALLVNDTVRQSHTAAL
jgi:hypothetical protein